MRDAEGEAHCDGAQGCNACEDVSHRAEEEARPHVAQGAGGVGGRDAGGMLAGTPADCAQVVSATASISTSAPEGSAETSTVERAGGASPTCLA